MSLYPPPQYTTPEIVQNTEEVKQVKKSQSAACCNGKFKAFLAKLWFYVTHTYVFLAIDVVIGFALLCAPEFLVVRATAIAMLLLGCCIQGILNKKPAFCLPYMVLYAARALVCDGLIIYLLREYHNESYTSRRDEKLMLVVLVAIPLAFLAHLSEYRLRHTYCKIKEELGKTPLISFTFRV
ncbi:hypothetical protein Ddc_05173 [Ditylenchus destructor]|nr:hypothetical protein Ddc_05173 [Ditylenchus destructor]